MNTKPIRLAFILIGISIAVLSAYYVFTTSKKFPSLFKNTKEQDSAQQKLIQVEENGSIKYSSDFLSLASQKKYDELVTLAPELEGKYLIQDTDAHNKFIENELKGRKSGSHFVEYDGSRLTSSGVMLLQTDLITIVNNSNDTIKVIASHKIGDEIKSDIKNQYQVDPFQRISFQFDFLGAYEIGIGSETFKVTVVKEYE